MFLKTAPSTHMSSPTLPVNRHIIIDGAPRLGYLSESDDGLVLLDKKKVTDENYHNAKYDR